MLTHKYPPRDFGGSARENSTKNRLYPLQIESLGGRNLAGFCEESASLARTDNSSISMTYSGCAGRLRRTRLCYPNSLITGKIQGISLNTPLPWRTNPLNSEICLDEFPAVGTGNFWSRTAKLTAELRNFPRSTGRRSSARVQCLHCQTVSSGQRVSISFGLSKRQAKNVVEPDRGSPAAVRSLPLYVQALARRQCHPHSRELSAREPVSRTARLNV